MFLEKEKFYKYQSCLRDIKETFTDKFIWLNLYSCTEKDFSKRVCIWLNNIKLYDVT
jgi:hypothetical protein